jgi:hypothetical protein
MLPSDQLQKLSTTTRWQKLIVEKFVLQTYLWMDTGLLHIQKMKANLSHMHRMRI